MGNLAETIVERVEKKSNVWPSFPADLPHRSLARMLIGSVLMRDLFWDAGRDKHWLHEARPPRTSELLTGCELFTWRDLKNADWKRGYKFTGPGWRNPLRPDSRSKIKTSNGWFRPHNCNDNQKLTYWQICLYIYIFVLGFHSTRTRFRGDAGDSREKAVGEMGRDSGIYSIWYLSI